MWCATLRSRVLLPLQGTRLEQGTGFASQSALLPASPPTKRRFVAPTADVGWHTFPTQAAALEFASTLPKDEDHVWSRELNAHGKRSYVVASRANFWRRYRTLHPPFRHYYELIRTGEPCNLYFDLEFCRHANPLADGDAMVGTLVREVRLALAFAYFGGHMPECTISDLESSTARKFSRHLVVRVVGAAFSNSLVCGYFVHTLCTALAERRADDLRIAALFVAPPAPAGPAPSATAAEASFSSVSSSTSIDGPASTDIPGYVDATTDTSASADSEQPGSGALRMEPAPPSQPNPPSPAALVCLVDLSVYSRNRCFRLYKSSKAGKQAQLLPQGLSEEQLYFLPHAFEAGALRCPRPRTINSAHTCSCHPRYSRYHC